MIQFDRAAKHYGRKIALHELTLSIPRGSVCALLGANGAGKTTTLNLILGITRPTRGQVRVLGLDPAKQVLDVRQLIGYVPEQHYIFPTMRVKHLLAMCARLYRDWDRAECARLIERLGLPTSPRVNELSRGQVVKVALVIALSHKPELLILDEPTSGLDPIVRREFLTLVAQLARERNGTILFSTHILSDVERIADQVVVMNAGQVIANDSLASLRDKYRKASMLFPVPPDDERDVPGAIRVDRSLREWVALFPVMPDGQIQQIARDVGASDCLVQSANLDDVYVEMINGTNGQNGQNGAPAK